MTSGIAGIILLMSGIFALLKNNSTTTISGKILGSYNVTATVPSLKPGFGSFNMDTVVQNQFPLVVPHYEVRRDINTNSIVQRGRVGRATLHGALWDHSVHRNRASRVDRVSYFDLTTDYQCAVNEPDFDDQNGAISIMRMAPPTMRTVEWVSAYAETRCPHSGPESCQGRVDQFKKGSYPVQFGVYSPQFNPFEQVFRSLYFCSFTGTLLGLRTPFYDHILTILH